MADRDAIILPRRGPPYTMRVAHSCGWLDRVQGLGGLDLDELKPEFEELALEDGTLEVPDFTNCEIEQVLLDDEPETVESGPLTPSVDAAAVAQLGDAFALGPHRVVCGDARNPAVLAKLMKEERARLLLTDEPYNVPIGGHLTGGEHREFAMASGGMT